MSSSRPATTAAAKRPLRDLSPALASLLANPATRTLLPFINGGLAGMTATTAIQPIDMVKVRLQLAGEGVKTGPRPSPWTVTRDIIAAGKVGDLYTGLSAGLLRQAVYTTARLGFFDTFMGALKVRAETAAAAAGKNGNNAATAAATGVGFKERALAGLSAGGLAACIGTPADLALIRMQSDGLKPLGQQAHYRGVVDALTRITKTEGLGALWAGAAPTIARAMALNFGQLAFFSEAKGQLAARAPEMDPGLRMLAASAVAGFFASFFSLPFDFVKTRLQKAKGASGAKSYRGMADCFARVAKEEGLLRFYRGFGTYYVRIAPHA